MNGYHIYIPRSNESLVSLLTWAVSIVSWNRVYGNIRLFTSLDGLKKVKEHGLDVLYKGNIDTVLEGKSVGDIRGINNISDINGAKRAFWAWMKLLALEEMKAPCCIVDLDGIVWNRIPEDNFDVACVHFEGKTWHNYSANKSNFGNLIGEELLSDELWDISPLCVGVLYIKDQVLLNYYKETVYGVMDKALRTIELKRLISGDIMRFTEQRIISLCAGKLKNRISELTSLRDDSTLANPWVSHLGGSKYRYPHHWEGERRYVTYLLEYLKLYARDASKLIEWAEGEMKRIDQANSKWSGKELIKSGHKFFNNIEGVLVSRDPNIPVYRRVRTDGTINLVNEEFILLEGRCDITHNNITKGMEIGKIEYGDTEFKKGEYNKLRGYLGEMYNI